MFYKGTTETTVALQITILQCSQIVILSSANQKAHFCTNFSRQNLQNIYYLFKGNVINKEYTAAQTAVMCNYFHR